MSYANRRSKWRSFAALLWAALALSASGARGPGRLAAVDWRALRAADAPRDQLLVRYDSARVRRPFLGPRVRGMRRRQAALPATAALRARVRHEFRHVPWQVITLPEGVSLEEAAARYRADPAVLDVEPNYTVTINAVPNDPLFDQLWGMQRIGAPAAWDKATGAPTIVVAVIDTGIRYTHEDLAPHMWVNPAPTFGDIHGARWVDGTGVPTSGDPMDGHGHGTHVAGTIGAVGHNGRGVAGVNWRVQLMALKFLNDAGRGQIADAIAAIEYAIDHGAHISCNAWGGGPYSAALHAAITRARSANHLFVAAAGNHGTDNDTRPFYPSGYPVDNIIAVASLDVTGARSGFSNFGATSVDIAAPGSDILSCWASNDTAYHRLSGTSMAAPHVAGAAALMLGRRPTATYSELRDAILFGARPNAAFAGIVTTGGELDLWAALVRFTGLIGIDRAAYRSNASVTATVTDLTAAGGTVTVSWETRRPDSTLRAAGAFAATRVPGTIDFVGTLTLSTGVTAVHGDTLTVAYNAAGGVVPATADIDDIPPTIGGLAVSSPDVGALQVAWRTDEPAIGGARIGRTLPPSEYARQHTMFVTEHTELFGGLPPFTGYYVGVWSEDRAGNRAELPANPASANPSDYAVGVTFGSEEVVRYDMERGPSGWTAQAIVGAACWQHGRPTYGPEIASRCWGTILDGRYPDSANATLTSPVVTVRTRPSIAFLHWYDIETTPNRSLQILDADCGYVEVLSRGVWHNVNAYARPALPAGRVTGTGSGWEPVRIVLPDAFANQPLQVRFRFLSDAVRMDRGNPAGWYIDNVAFHDLPAAGVGLAGVELDDAAPGGNGNGTAESGETIRIRLTAFNVSGAPVPIREGSFVLLVGGVSSPRVRLTGGSPGVLNYGTLPVGLPVVSGWYEVAIDPVTPPGTLVTVLQTLVAGNGSVHEGRASFRIQRLGPIAGRVVEPRTSGDVGVSGALVEARQADELHTATTDADGRFTLPLTGSNVAYRLTARRGGAHVTTTVVAPTNVLLRLQLALLDLAPPTLALTAPHGSAVTNRFTVANRPTATAVLDYTLSIRYTVGQPVDWLSITSPPELSGSLPAGASREYFVRADATLLPVGRFTAYIDVASNDSDAVPDVVTVTLDVEETLRLEVAGTRVDDTATGDGDGTLDPGETAGVYLQLRNRNLFGIVSGLTGNVTVYNPPGGATVTGGNPLAWPLLGPNSVVESLTPVTIAWNPPPAQPAVLFNLAGQDILGRSFTLDFSMTNTPRHSMAGTVTWRTALPLTPPNVVFPLVGATVTAEALDGTVLLSTLSDTNGMYRLDGMVPNQPYWVRLEVPAGMPLVPPAGVDLRPATDPGFDGNILTRDFQALNYGTNTPLLRLESTSFDDRVHGDGDGAIDPGERLRVSVNVRNVGPVSLLAAVGTADEAFMHTPGAMVVSAGAAGTPTNVPSGAVASLAPFEIDVNPTAQNGDFQRFWVWSYGTNDAAVIWPLDFRLDVAARYRIAGTVGFTDGGTPAKFADTRVTATSELGVSATVTPASDGAYTFVGLPSGLNYAVRVSQVPVGYEQPPEQTLFLDGNRTGVNFMVRPWAIGITPTPNPLNLTIAEGASATQTLHVVNGGASARDVTLAIRYERAPGDLLPAVADVLAGLAQSWPASWANLDANVFANELEIRFHDGTPMVAREAYLKRHNLEAVFHFRNLPAVLARPAGGAPSLAVLGGPVALAEPDLVAYLHPSVIMTRQALPNDPRFDELWGLHNRRQTDGTHGADIDVASVWDRATGNAATVVAIGDTGAMLAHEDLADNIWHNPGESGLDLAGRDRATNGIDDDGNGFIDDVHGWNFFHWNNDLTDWVGHGTHVAGTVGAVGNNAIGVAGVNWDVALMILRLTNARGTFTTSARIAAAMEYAMNHGAPVSNHSWGGPVGAGILYETMHRGIAANHLFVVAAGNAARNNDVNLTFPAYYSTVLDNVVVVSAADHDDRLARFSNYGPDSVHLAAPGVDVLSTYPRIIDLGGGQFRFESTYEVLSGTSMAAPHVAGAAGLLWSIAPGAPYDVIKTALLRGVRQDADLTTWVKNGGHLDVAGALSRLGQDWLVFANAGLPRITVTIPAGATTNLALWVNAPPTLGAGQYRATIDVSDHIASVPVPVNLTVNARGLPRILTVEVRNDTDGDGHPENGEGADLWIAVRNTGSATLANLSGVLVPVTPGAGVAAVSNRCVYGYVSGLDNAAPDRPFRVTFPSTGSPALFRLALTNNAVQVALLPVEIALAPKHRVSGRVVRAAAPATGVGGAIVEVWGAMGVSAVSAADGTFAVNGLAPGSYTLRVIPPTQARPATRAVNDLTGNVAVGDIPVAAPLAAPATNRVVLALQQGLSSNVTVAVTRGSAHAADPYAFQTLVAPRRRVALISDGQTLGNLIAPLHAMGFAVDWYTNNFAVLHYFDPATGRNEILQYVRHTWDDALLMQHDFVVADVSGPAGAGRPFPDYEAQAFRNYLQRGGKALFTGVNPLSRPDNEELVALLGLDTNAMNRVDGSIGQAVLWDAPTGPFVTLAAGVSLATAARDYDQAGLASLGTGQRIAGIGLANKLLRNGVGLTGAAYLWTGNPGTGGDWQREGAWLDILRNILWRDLVVNAPVTWLTATPAAGTAPGVLTLAVNANRLAPPGTHRATVHLLGMADGQEVLPIDVEFTVAPPVLQAHNASGQVVDWGGRPLAGDGSERSSLLQILWVGTNGVVDPPRPDGSAGGDDVPLVATISGQPFGRFGSGYELTPDRGKFAVAFDHGFAPGTPGIVLYARAWDAATPAAAMAYGDSTVRYTLRYLPDETADFGSWAVRTIVSRFADSNGDGIPDHWTITFRPDLDPRAPRLPTTNVAQTAGANQLASLPAPARLVVSTNFLFVLEQGKQGVAAHRLAVYNRATMALVARYGRNNGNASGTGDGEFNFPVADLGPGIAADPRPGVFRFAVADRGNHRIQVFTYNPLTGTVTFERKFGTQSGTPSVTAPNGTFSFPCGVSFTDSGEILVADTGNFRVQWFNATGGHKRTIPLTAVGGSPSSVPHGIAFDFEGEGDARIDGFWVADAHNTRQHVAFYALAGGGIPSRIVGGSGSGVFDSPTDVRVWTVGTRRRLCVVDMTGNRVRVMDRDGTALFHFGQDFPGAQTFERLQRPYGVMPVNGTRVVYVADRGKDRVVWYNLTLDADGDGMEDIWEDLEGLDSTRDDAMEDPDGDGLPNIGEFRAGARPRNRDTDGDGRGDLHEMVNALNPLVPDAPHYVPPRLLTLTAVPTVVVTGGVVTVTATYDRAPTAPITAYFHTDAGAGRGSSAMLPAGGGIYQCTFPTTAGDLGVFDVVIHGLDQDPPIQTVLGNDLFRVTRPLGASVTRHPDPVLQGQPVTITVTFSEAVQDAPAPRLTLAGGATLGPVAMTRLSATVYRYVYATQAPDLGVVNGLVSDAVAVATGEILTPVPFAFVITPASIPQVNFTRIVFEPPVFLRLTWPAPMAAGDPMRRFEIYYALSLTPTPTWTLWGTVDVSGPATEGTALVNLALLPPSDRCFFRIVRIQ